MQLNYFTDNHFFILTRCHTKLHTQKLNIRHGVLY